MISPRRMLLVAAGGFAISVVFLALGVRLALWRHQSLQAAATPPEEMQTIEGFLEWKASEVLGRGTYTDNQRGATYQVLLAPSGRFLASGPSAYLFDEGGDFVEWTPDMGDTGTSLNGYDLSSGKLDRTD